jgi:Calcineurin-like phosphoesterase
MLALWLPLGTLGAVHLWGWWLRAYGRGQPTLANTALNVSHISIPAQKAGEPAPSWKFAVLGDLGRRYQIFSDFLSQMKRDDIKFVIICGDLAYRTIPEQYEYLHLKIAQSGFDRPIFAAVGHHDVVSKNDYGLFRRSLGDLDSHGKAQVISDLPYGGPYVERFAFTVPEHPPFQALFIIFDHVFAPPGPEQLSWIERLLKNYRSQVRQVFLFSHVPIVKMPKRIQRVPSKEWLMPFERMEKPRGDGGGSELLYELIKIDPAATQTPLIPLTKRIDPQTQQVTFPHPLLLGGYERLYELLDQYHVTAVFSGDLHGYARYQLGSTLHFVSGGGGARLQYPEALYHYLQVEVNGDGINVRPVVLAVHTGVVAKVEQDMIVEIFLPLVHRPWFYVFLIVWVGGCVVLLRLTRRWSYQ